jgi:hypothetical protein
MAGAPQDAVDHCLIAKIVAAAIAGPVHCLIDSHLQHNLACAALPESALLADLPGSTGSTTPVTSDSLESLFEIASTRLGRPRAAIETAGPAGAGDVLVACGETAVAIRKLVEQGWLNADVRLVHVQLLKPFPRQELLAQVSDAGQIHLVVRANHPAETALLAAVELLRAEHPSLTDLLIHTIDQPPGSPLELVRQLSGSLSAGDIANHAASSGTSGLNLSLGISPASTWGRGLLVEAAAWHGRSSAAGALADASPFDLAADVHGRLVTISVGDDRSDPGALDALVYTLNEWSDIGPGLEKLKPNGTLLIYGAAEELEELRLRMVNGADNLIAENHLQAWWLCPAQLHGIGDDPAVAIRQLVTGALLRALAPQTQQESLPGLMRIGWKAVRKWDWSQAVHQGKKVQAADSRSAPRSAGSAGPGQPDDVDHALWGFHLTGKGAWNELNPAPGLPLWPALATRLIDEHPLAGQYPLVLPPRDADPDVALPVSPLEELTTLRGVAVTDSAVHPDPSDQEQIVGLIEKLADIHPLEEGHEALADANFAGNPELRDRINGLAGQGRLAGFGPHTLLYLYDWAVAASQDESGRQFDRELQSLIHALQDRLQTDRLQQEGDRESQSLGTSMGVEATRFVDLDKLSDHLPTVSGSEQMTDSTRRLIEETLGCLRAWYDSADRELPFYVISSRPVDGIASLPAAARIAADDCFETALGFSEGLLHKMAGVFRAMRIARLVLAARYEPEVHDEVFSRFEWQSCSDDEIRRVPKVLVVESSSRIRRKKTEESLNRLLRSGRPIDVLVTLDESALTPEDMSGALEDLGGIAMANREAFVLQSSLARPHHLVTGLRDLVRSLRPSVALILAPPAFPQTGWAWACELLSLYSRMAPTFCYAPDRGPAWSDRFDISDNPQLDAGQPVFDLASASLPGAAESMEEAVTFAHAAALLPEYQSHFRVIPESAWTEKQVPIGQYLTRFGKQPPAELPFIQVVRGGELYRAIVTREMANACRDRWLAWRNLQELAGINNEHVNRARQAVRQELETHIRSEAEQARVAGRKEGAELAVRRIVDALLGEKGPQSGDTSAPPTRQPSEEPSQA